jgi:hypothetical protein
MDVDNDGVVELVLIDELQDTVTVFENQSRRPLPRQLPKLFFFWTPCSELVDASKQPARSSHGVLKLSAQGVCNDDTRCG